MEMIIGQLQYFGASFLWGIVLMFLYDFLEVFRCRVHHGKVWLFIEDWLFWLVAAVFVFQMIFALNHGIIRSFFILSFIGGMMLYRGLVKRHLICAVLAVISFFCRPFAWIRRKVRRNISLGREKKQKSKKEKLRKEKKGGKTKKRT